MLHTHSRIWIHLVWATKNRQRVIHKPQGLQLFDFLITKGKSLDIPFEKLNIQPEHVHALIDLPTNKMLSEFMQSIKKLLSRKNINNGNMSTDCLMIEIYWRNNEKPAKSRLQDRKSYTIRTAINE